MIQQGVKSKSYVTSMSFFTIRNEIALVLNAISASFEVNYFVFIKTIPFRICLQLPIIIIVHNNEDVEGEEDDGK